MSVHTSRPFKFVCFKLGGASSSQYSHIYGVVNVAVNVVVFCFMTFILPSSWTYLNLTFHRSKSSRGAPAYRVFMKRSQVHHASTSSSSSASSSSSSSSASSVLPNASDLNFLFRSYRDGAPLLFASLADCDDPAFFVYYDVTLPPAPVNVDTV